MVRENIEKAQLGSPLVVHGSADRVRTGVRHHHCGIVHTDRAGGWPLGRRTVSHCHCLAAHPTLRDHISAHPSDRPQQTPGCIGDGSGLGTCVGGRMTDWDRRGSTSVTNKRCVPSVHAPVGASDIAAARRPPPARHRRHRRSPPVGRCPRRIRPARPASARTGTGSCFRPMRYACTSSERRAVAPESRMPRCSADFLLRCPHAGCARDGCTGGYVRSSGRALLRAPWVRTAAPT